MSKKRYGYVGLGLAGFEQISSEHSPGFLQGLLDSMVRIRTYEEEIESRYHEDQMKTPIHLVIGQEATCVGACAALGTEDVVYTSHRTHGVYLAKGSDMKAMTAEFFCRQTGCVGSRGGSMHLLHKPSGFAGGSSIVGGSVPHAVGAALAFKMRKQDRVAVAFLGDATIEEGAFWESLNFAVLHQLPVVFFCENNFYSVYTPLHERQPENAPPHRKAAGFGLPSAKVDGSNVVLVYEAMKEAVHRARGGEGPSFLEATVGRWRGHGGAGDDSHKGYRDPAEVAEWQAHCPIEMLHHYLVGRGDLAEGALEAMREKARAETLEALEFGAKSAPPAPDELLKHIYAD